ncbi:MAG TPA: MBOAT family O-acyltransferase, partial [Lachnospiraceae bacterium]|nr:MBOAT family O-acyltransferase [Lachnospiraceae bacterium]
LLCATVFYAVQIYCDFSGYMDIVIGVSELFGIKIAENFNKPYFSKSIAEYWRRWHITLGTWFKDYLYYSVIRSEFCRRIGKKFGKGRLKDIGRTVPTVIGLLVVWFMTGLWHGASWHYVAHGLYHGGIIILSVLLAPVYKKVRIRMHIEDASRPYHVLQMLRTFILVDISYILFRSATMEDAGYIMNRIFFHLQISFGALKEAVLPFTEDNTAVAYFGVVAAAMALLFISEVLDYNHKQILKKHRYINAALMILAVLLFGVFGQSGFIYAAY